MLTHAHSEIVYASLGRSSRIRHRNALTERAWKDAVQGLGKTRSTLTPPFWTGPMDHLYGTRPWAPCNGPGLCSPKKTNKIKKEK